jgi:UDP-hydrolysing UDP-N-acetyl-D-glucosamine 2-epimerase
LNQDPDFRLILFVTGTHLSPEFGLTVGRIRDDGFAVDECVEMLLSSDSPEGIAKSAGLGIIGFAQTFARTRPDVLVVLGDRFEMYAAAVAALPFKIPVAHIHGGEITRGAIDDPLRHSMTKLSHLHFVANEVYARRVIQMGEEPWRVVESGALSLDNLRETRLLTREGLHAEFGLRIESPPLIVTYHPVTLEFEQTEWQVNELLAAIEASEMPAVFTMPNADTSGRLIWRRIKEFVSRAPRAQLVENLGTQGYFSLMACAAAMVGNSSSGLVEAPSFGLPVVNVGSRQEGRVRASNVIDVGYGRAEILQGVRDALQPQFRDGLRGLENPYGTGTAVATIAAALAEISLDERLLVKRFHELDAVTPAALVGSMERG